MGLGRKFWTEQAKWSNKTFGNELQRGPIGPLKHLKKEIDEAITAAEFVLRDTSGPSQEALHEELVDCLFLVFDAARRSGMRYQDLIQVAFRKLEKNKKRQWISTAPDEPIEHSR